MSTSTLFLGMLFGSVGLGFVIYGKKQGAVVPLVCGLVLMIFPYFVSNAAALLIVGILLAAAPFFIKL